MKNNQTTKMIKRAAAFLSIFSLLILSFTSCNKEEDQNIGAPLLPNYNIDYPNLTSYSQPLEEDKVITVNITDNNTPIRAVVFYTCSVPQNNAEIEDYLFYNESDDENFVNTNINVPVGGWWNCDESMNFAKFLPLNCAENEYFKAEFNEDFSQLTYTIKTKINEVINQPYTSFTLLFCGDNSQYNADKLNIAVEDMKYYTCSSIEFQTSGDFKSDTEQ
ncbi:MAG: hypothetical protein R3Y50_08600 [Rikenellaceae bacterium]